MKSINTIIMQGNAEGPMLRTADLIPSSSGLEIFHIGPPLNLGPLPAFFYFALSGRDSLEFDPFNQPAAFLKDEPVRIFSFSLPGHGPGLKNTEAISYWAESFQNGQDLLLEFISQAKNNIEELIRLNLVDPERLAAGGLSRGGFAAAHLAANHGKINTLLGFAPMVKLELSEEFKKYPLSQTVLQYSLDLAIPKLIGKSVRFYIGNRDTRVHTDACYHFVRALAEASYEAKIRSPQVELVISPSIGNQGHGTAPHVFFNGVNWLKEQLRIL